MAGIAAITKCDQVAESIIQEIKNGTYNPGDRIPTETALAEQYGVSRVTIREACKKLSTLNVITIRQGGGTFVNSLEPSTFMKVLFPLLRFETDSIVELFDARDYIEQGSVELAAKRAGEQDIAELEYELKLQQQAIDKRDEYAYTELDTKFHRLLCKISGNRILLTTYDIINDMVSECILQTSKTILGMDVSYMRHCQIVSFLKNGDAKAAGEAMSEHIATTRDLLIEHMERQKSN